MGSLMAGLCDFIFTQMKVTLTIDMYISDDITVIADTQLCIFNKDRKLYIGCLGIQGERDGVIVHHSDIFKVSPTLWGYTEQELTELYNTIINNLFTQWHLT